ncbi:TRAP transporter large permease [Sulfitobacter sp. F26204]|uniref:TRAP transporter large permease n=1 Tax=Sulfitobacter sp. F26204 TaxID=2996014 RepID=UPI00225E3DA0|nr:TRAP transporter large permease [Sulfitobacter sp. F26204]MCX7560624.1 TRAP transporter large permease [Sulfitobacter sp. F26204]
MDPFVLGGMGMVLVLVLLILRVPIAFSLGAVAAGCTFLFYAWPPGGQVDFAFGFRAVVPLLTANSFNFVHSFQMSMVPLFIGLSHIAYHSGITTDIYNAARIWMSRLPGGLAIASIVGCGGFSALTGSSVACAAAMGRICTPEMLRAGYGPRIATSSVAVGGTLGSLIPPSVPFILYGIFTEQSIAKLLMAGILPGLLSLVAFVIVVLVWVRINPAEAPMSEETFTRAERMKALYNTWPALVVFGIILGGIYGGFFTATEAAAVSAAAAVLIGVVLRRLSWAAFVDSLRQTAYQTAMIFLIAFGAKMFVSFVALTRIMPWSVDLMQSLDLEQWQMLFAICLIYLVLGMFLDPIGILLLTLPFVIPLVEGMDLNLIWFGVIVVKLLEIGLITPPVGLNAFVIKSVIGNQIQTHTIFAGIARFLVADLIVLALLVAFPIISLTIPLTMR